MKPVTVGRRAWRLLHRYNRGPSKPLRAEKNKIVPSLLNESPGSIAPRSPCGSDFGSPAAVKAIPGGVDHDDTRQRVGPGGSGGDAEEEPSGRQGIARAPLASAERRRGPDRRQRVARALLYGSFNPRRRAPRREGEYAVGAIDWFHPWWLVVATLILLLCAGDAVLTVILISRGAYELNPLLAPLIGGSGALFAGVKVGLTGFGVVLLVLLSRVKAFGRMPVALILYGVLLGYGTLILYELRLLGWL